jgi:hypothetical protein
MHKKIENPQHQAELLIRRELLASYIIIQKTQKKDMEVSIENKIETYSNWKITSADS